MFTVPIDDIHTVLVGKECSAWADTRKKVDERRIG